MVSKRCTHPLAGTACHTGRCGCHAGRRRNQCRASAPPSTRQPSPRLRRPPRTPQGAVINVLGAGATMLGLSATIGVLLAKTLTSATVNPFLATSSSNWNPVLAFDVFNVQVGGGLEGGLEGLFVLAIATNRKGWCKGIPKTTPTGAAGARPSPAACAHPSGCVPNRFPPPPPPTHTHTTTTTHTHTTHTHRPPPTRCSPTFSPWSAPCGCCASSPTAPRRATCWLAAAPTKSSPPLPARPAPPPSESPAWWVGGRVGGRVGGSWCDAAGRQERGGRCVAMSGPGLWSLKQPAAPPAPCPVTAPTPTVFIADASRPSALAPQRPQPRAPRPGDEWQCRRRQHQ